MLQTCFISDSLAQIEMLKGSRQKIPLKEEVSLEIEKVLHRLVKIDTCNKKTSLELKQRVIELSCGDGDILEKLQAIFVKKLFKESIQKIKPLGDDLISLCEHTHVECFLSESDSLEGLGDMLNCVSSPCRSEILKIISRESIEHSQQLIYLSSEMFLGLCDDKSRMKILKYLVSLPVEDRESICNASMSLMKKLSDVDDRISLLERCSNINIDRRFDLLSSVFYLSASVSGIQNFLDILDVLESTSEESLSSFISTIAPVAFLITDGHKRAISIKYLQKISSSVLFGKITSILSMLLSGSFDDRLSLEIVKKIVKIESEIFAETLLDQIYLHTMHACWSDRSSFVMKVLFHENPEEMIAFLASTSTLMTMDTARSKHLYLKFFYGLLLEKKLSPLTSYFPSFFTLDITKQSNILQSFTYFEDGYFEDISKYVEQQSRLQRIDLDDTLSILLSIIEVESFRVSMCSCLMPHLSLQINKSDLYNFLTGVMSDKKILLGVKSFDSFITRIESRFSSDEQKEKSLDEAAHFTLIKTKFAGQEWSVNLERINGLLQAESYFKKVHNLTSFIFNDFVDHLERVVNQMTKEERVRVRSLYFKDCVYDFPVLIDNLKSAFFQKVLNSEPFDIYRELLEGFISFIRSNSIPHLEDKSLSCRDITLLLFSECMMRQDFFKKLELYKIYQKLDSQYKIANSTKNKGDFEKKIILDFLMQFFSQSSCKKEDGEHQISALKCDSDPIFPQDTRCLIINEIKQILDPTFIAQETVKRYNQLLGEDRVLMNAFISLLFDQQSIGSSFLIQRPATNSPREMQLDEAFELLIQMKILQDPSKN